MTFTNVTGAGVYLQCCHREVEPGGTFVVPWLRAKTDRGLRAAMAAGTLAWTSAADEPSVPGSPKIPKPISPTKAEKATKAAADAARLAARMKADEEAMRENMKRMGTFDVPQLTPRHQKIKSVAAEKPVTASDVIADDRPKSLADIRRHNRAVKTLAPAK